MKNIFTAILLMLSFTSVIAQNEVVIIGAGTKTCKQYMETTQNVSGNEKLLTDAMYVSWMQGYLSGKNRQLLSLGYKGVDIGKVEEFSAMLTFTCGNLVKQGKGTLVLFTVIDNLFEEGFDKKIRK